MNTVETTLLTHLVSQLAPGTKINDDTPLAWALVLDDVALDDAKAAVRTLYRERGNDEEYGPRRIEADDILREVKRIRAARLAAAPEYVPSRAGMTVEEEQAELRAYRRAVADGHTPPRPSLADEPHRTIRVLTKGMSS